MCSSTLAAAAPAPTWHGASSPHPVCGPHRYLVLRPHSYAADREEQELDMALRERQLAQYGTCPQCGAPIEKDFVVCPVCDTQVRNVCPSCHRPLDAHWKVCPYCRTRIQ